MVNDTIEEDLWQHMQNRTADSICIEIGINIVTNTYYRTMQIFHIILSISSVALILWVLKMHRKRLVFHYNIQILVTSLFCASLLHATLMTGFQVYQLILSYTYVRPCDVILSPLFFALIHMPFIYSILWIEAAQVVMLMEKAIAIYHVGNYETCGKKLGNSLFLLSVLIPLLEGLWAYADERFDNPEISCINTPVSRTTQVNALFALSLLFHMVALSTLSMMFCIHRKTTRLVGAESGPTVSLLQIKYAPMIKLGHTTADIVVNLKQQSFSAQTLSSRFQSSENLTSSRLLITLSAIQLVVFFSYGGSIMYLRMTFNSTTDLPIYRSNILAAYLVPVYTFLLPLITTIFLRNMRQARKSEIRSMIEIKASGAEGWANYSSQLERQWNS